MRALIDDILRIRDASALVAQAMADEIPGAFQLAQGCADAVHAFLADGSQSARRVVPILRQGQNNGQQTLGLEGYSPVLEMNIAHDRVIPILLYAKNSHRKILRFMKWS